MYLRNIYLNIKNINIIMTDNNSIVEQLIEKLGYLQKNKDQEVDELNKKIEILKCKNRSLELQLEYERIHILNYKNQVNLLHEENDILKKKLENIKYLKLDT